MLFPESNGCIYHLFIYFAAKLKKRTGNYSLILCLTSPSITTLVNGGITHCMVSRIAAHISTSQFRKIVNKNFDAAATYVNILFRITTALWN